MHHNYTYVVFDIDEVHLIDKIYNVKNLRWNSRNTKCFIKFLGDAPYWCINKPLYNKKKMLKILETW